MHFIDMHVGRVIRTRRESLDFAKSDLAQHLDMSVEELDAREAGRGRFGASDLLVVCQSLGLKPSDIFSGLKSNEDKARPCPLCGAQAAGKAAARAP